MTEVAFQHETARRRALLMPSFSPLSAVSLGGKPLSREARLELECLEGRPIPRLAFNPRVSRELARTHVVDMVDLPRPFKGGGLIKYLQINDSGREYLKATRAQS